MVIFLFKVGIGVETANDICLSLMGACIYLRIFRTDFLLRFFFCGKFLSFIDYTGWLVLVITRVTRFLQRLRSQESFGPLQLRFGIGYYVLFRSVNFFTQGSCSSDTTNGLLSMKSVRSGLSDVFPIFDCFVLINRN